MMLQHLVPEFLSGQDNLGLLKHFFSHLGDKLKFEEHGLGRNLLKNTLNWLAGNPEEFYFLPVRYERKKIIKSNVEKRKG